jgi:Uma2 family endonuclease
VNNSTLGEVRAIVGLLIKRPITEEIVTQVRALEDYQLLEIADAEWVGFEEGTEDVTGEEHGWIEAKIIHEFMGYVLEHNAGRIYPGDTDFVLDGEPGNIRLLRKPDVAFVTRERVKPSRGLYYGVPDLAVEIISPSQSYSEVREKVSEYLTHGARQVWFVLPQNREIEVHLSGGIIRTYHPGDTVPGGDLLPGFSLDVAAVFEA